MIEKIVEYWHVIWDWEGTWINDVWFVKVDSQVKFKSARCAFDI